MYEKKNKALKALVAVLSVILVMCLTVAGTLAYLQMKTESVVNTFSPSNIDLTLTETDKAYKMVPGVDIDKDPKVTVTADIPCYVFLKVEKSANFDTYMTYQLAEGWNELPDIDGVFYREVTADGGEFGVLAGNKVTVPNTVTKTEMNALYNDDGTVKDEAELPKLTFTAYAIQKNGFEDNLLGAWNEAHGQVSGS